MSEIRVPLKCNPILVESIAFNTDLDFSLILLQQYNLRILSMSIPYEFPKILISIWTMFLNELKTYLISTTTHQLLFKFIS